MCEDCVASASKAHVWYISLRSPSPVKLWTNVCNSGPECFEFGIQRLLIEVIAGGIDRLIIIFKHHHTVHTYMPWYNIFFSSHSAIRYRAVRLHGCSLRFFWFLQRCCIPSPGIGGEDESLERERAVEENGRREIWGGRAYVQRVYKAHNELPEYTVCL